MKVMTQRAELLINGRFVPGKGELNTSHNPYNHEPVAEGTLATEEQMREAIAGARAAFRDYRNYPSHRRASLLLEMSRLIAENLDDIARTIAVEVGKPIKTARIEVTRSVSTFRMAALELSKLSGEVISMDLVPHGEGRTGFYIRQPIGVIGAITPFNFPFNLVAHKVAPALAVGNTVVLKPTLQARLSALKMGELILQAGFPPGALNVAPCSNRVASALIESPDVAMISFTGSVPVGKQIRNQAGLKKVVLELGSNAANIVAASADLEQAADAIARAGFAYAGQSCIHAQRIYVHRSLLDRFLQALLPKVEALRLGDPLSEDTDVGPMITEESARRAESWVEEARAGGARVLAGGSRDGSILHPTVLMDVTPEMKVVCEEVFGPVIAVIPFEDFGEAIRQVNDSKYGLNAGVFTQNVSEAFHAMRELEVGSVLINDASSFRADHMPYGGVKESGLGREGLRFAMEEMTEIKFASFNLSAA